MNAKKLLCPFAVLLYVAMQSVSCNNRNTKNDNPENSLDAATTFIRYALDGNFNEARSLLLADSINNNYLDIAERSFSKTGQATKDGYKAASIVIHEIQDPVPDSISIIIFSNSFKNDHDTLRVIKKEGRWQIDLKYLYDQSAENKAVPAPVQDSLP